jgi:flavin-dependent dehydrogenase
LAPHFDEYFTWTSLTTTHQQKPQMPALLNEFQQHGKIYSANMRWRIFRPLCTEGLILTGDAAAVIDPAAGQGILNALWSGIYAGKTAVSCMAHPSYENIYLASYDQWFLEQYETKVFQLRKLYSQHGIQINTESTDL